MTRLFFFITALFISAPVLYADENENSSFTLCRLFSYEHPEQKGPDQKRWSLNLGGAYIENKGNTDSMDINWSASIKYDDNIMVFKTAASGFYGKTGGIKDEDRGLGSANFDYYLFQQVEFFSYTMSEYNDIIELKHRNNSGAGIKLVFVRNPFLLIDLSGAPIVQYEKFLYRESKKDRRWSVRGRVELFPFSDDLSVMYYAYYIPAMDDAGNYRTIQDFSIYKKIMGALGIKGGCRREYNTYDKEVLAEKPWLKKTDTLLYFQLTLSI